MRISSPAAAGAAFIISLAGLCIPAILAQRMNINNLLLVFPDGPGSPRINIGAVEEFSQKEFLLSYEISGAERISLPYADFSVTVIGTTSSYFQILQSELIEGSFFSKQAWDGKQRHAVLNETAAFAVFGSSSISGSRFRMGADTWLVSGVIQDGDEEHNRIYVPSSLVRENEAGPLLALMQPSNGIDEAYIISSLKTLGIQEGRYVFFNLRTQTGLLWERAGILSLVFFGLLFLSLLRPLAGKFGSSLAALKAERGRHYLREILQKKPKLTGKPALLALALFLCIAAALILFLRAASIILPWQDIPSLAVLERDLFYPRLLDLRNLEFASRLLFIASAALLAVFFTVLNVFMGTKKK